MHRIDGITVQDIILRIASGSPVVVIVPVFKEFMDDSDWRYKAAIDTPTTLAGYHVVLITGYNKQADNTIFTFRNSWGMQWGHNGYGTLDQNLLNFDWSQGPSYDIGLSY